MSLTNISFFLCTLFSLSTLAQKFDKAAFYQVMETKDSIKINQQLESLQNTSIKEKQAYEGALLLKKAGVIASKKDKLATFKLGKRKLENALEKDSSNTEYHFLRLMTQENAPKILGYHANLEKDNIYIRKNYKTLSAVLQQAILGYSKQSKTLSNLSTETK
ncbi:MAG TPA: hypothetical protein VNX01_01160 [Bacteroidia bacterium]|nr:hypothetical protein [Bacteroidia bacterium]